MSGRAGIELTPTLVRLVRLAPLSHRVTHSVEIPWDPTRPTDAVRSLRATTGRLQGIALSIGLGFLEVARLELPPVSPSERARIAELEPDRYFAAASREHLTVTVAPAEPIAFGVPTSLVSAWIAAFGACAPVEWVEPSPLSLARVLGPRADATYQVEAGGADSGLLQLVRGRLASVRRTSDRSAVRNARSLPATGSLPPQFAAAFGAARWLASTAVPVPALAPDEWRRRQASRRRAVLAANVVMAAAALSFSVWAADRWRERTLSALRERVTEVETRGASADTALRALRSRELESRTLLESTASRPDPHSALALISDILPRDATVLTARVTGNDWQVDGTASDASKLVPLLDRHERLDSVRFLSASSRYRDRNGSYETFSIAFRVLPQP